jgi:hypothetical protein
MRESARTVRAARGKGEVGYGVVGLLHAASSEGKRRAKV